MEETLLGCLTIFLILFVIALIVFGPLISIWAVNLLFGLTIPMNIGTWFAAFWLGGLGSIGRLIPNKKDKSR